MTETYLVGGAVRDELMGVPCNDYDYVVVGSTPEQMLNAGYTQVGSDFPVFLHPKTGDEYALARTEFSTGNGYGDFEVAFGPNVTLLDDLWRRDLTINAMAKCDMGVITYDPFHGQNDIENRVLRHVSDAFKDDPVRILRVARFAARFGFGWKVAKETEHMMTKMVKDGMLDSLTPERVWKELEKALMGVEPRKFFDVLDSVGALEVVFPVIHKMKTVLEHVKYHPEGNTYEHTMLVLEQARLLTDDPAVMFAALTHDFGKTLTDPAEYPHHHGHENTGVGLVEEFSDQFKVPAHFKRTAKVVCKNHMKMKHLDQMSARSVVKTFVTMKAKAVPSLVDDLVTVAKADARGKLGFHDTDVSGMNRLKEWFEVYDGVKFMVEVRKAGLKEQPKGEAASNFLRQAQVITLKQHMKG